MRYNMSEPKLLPSNEFWGNRSGSFDKSTPNAGGQPVGNIFRQMQYGSGPSRTGKPVKTSLVNVPHKYFGKSYKSKRG